MNIKVESLGDVSVVKCGGNLDADSVAVFKKITSELVNQGSVRLVVDCSLLKFIDSMGLGAMISLLRRVRSRDGDVKVSALNADVKAIFEITRLHRLFEVCTDAKAACKSFKG
ncbi:MAG: hypothetical protein A3I05_00915 [Deltaproteobacteria bacterium RIFCSPLOWO2_02_FULL_44_10]|nr:MAG: hypothetical protein A3C46_06590 [Deltaproteobacteria bacterium RIFCSPHIGHO2_02_FULL_44_16]OGQ45316.1 MAG: hypothetical protein A3I05_00915 [Deltaproteobacteria bacterium RIFCSPLOWO2_02_FULL_44_10]